MQILLANAKIMFEKSNRKASSVPLFQSVANELAAEMARLDVDELARQLDCSRAIAAENWRRYQNFLSAETMPAILAYNGQAYKHLKANTLSEEALQFGQKHLWITCFLYGLLRPLDAIVPYRMEHCVTLEATSDKPVNQYWAKESKSQGTKGLGAKDQATMSSFDLTQTLIDSVKADDGILIHLSTEEYEHLFDWKRVKEEIQVIQPLFYIRQSDGSLKMQAVWAKACRGAMVRYILQNQITSPEELKGFFHEGFEYNPNLGEEAFPHFIR